MATSTKSTEPKMANQITLIIGGQFAYNGESIDGDRRILGTLELGKNVSEEMLNKALHQGKVRMATDDLQKEPGE